MPYIQCDSVKKYVNGSRDLCMHEGSGWKPEKMELGLLLGPSR